MTERTNWNDLRRPRSAAAQSGYEDEARISEFQELAYRLRVEAGLTQVQLAQRMGTSQSAVARMEGGGVRPTFETLQRLAAAVGLDVVVAMGENLCAHRWVAEMLDSGRAVIREAR